MFVQCGTNVVTVISYGDDFVFEIQFLMPSSTEIQYTFGRKILFLVNGLCGSNRKHATLIFT